MSGLRRRSHATLEATIDGKRFDSLTRTLTDTGSRRRDLIASIGGALTIALGGATIEEAEAKKKKACPPCKKRKKGKCKKKLPDGTACVGGSCQGGSCVAVATSPALPPAPPCVADCAGKICGDDGCGGLCGFACTDGNTCQNGACVCASEKVCYDVCCSSTEDVCTESPQVCCRSEKVCHKSCCGRNESCVDGANGKTCEPMVIGP